jgi:CubicO group peptidase (beta-lactamase class C family)
MNKVDQSVTITSLAVILFLFLHRPVHAGEGGSQTNPVQMDLAVEEVQKVCQSETDNNTVPGIAIAVVSQNHVMLTAGFGVRDVETRAPVDADTVFQLASLSKPIGATVVAALIGEGKISWDSRISDLDPNFAMYDPWVTREITIRDFYSHRSGLPPHSGDLLEDLGFSRQEILHRLRYQRPDSSFRSHYAYTNFGITEAGVAAAKAYGMIWEDASDQKLYRPLGMSSTSSRYADFVARTNKALGHVRENGKWVQKYQRDPDTESPAGGVSSSAKDLAKWMRLQPEEGEFDGKRIVDARALSEAHSPQMLTGFSPLDGLPTFYGLGWNVNYDRQGRLRLGHSGAFALGAATNVLLVPSEHLGVAVLTNAYPIGVAEGIANTFADVALYGKATRDWIALFKRAFSDPAAIGVSLGADYSKPPASPSPALANTAYLGNYTNNFFGDIQIIERDNGLAIVEGPQKTIFLLAHYDRDTFTYKTEGENAVGATGVTFAIGPDGKANQVVVENLNVRGEGVFKPVRDNNTH